MFELLFRSFALRIGGALLAATALLAGCGGGGSSPTEQATSYTEGVITGFGSIIVNGIRFDDSSASVSDDDGTPDQGRGDLQIGMVVEIEGADVDRDRGVGRALHIRFGSEIVGPVASKGTSSVVVLGQTIDIKPSTVFDDSLPGGLASIQIGDVIEVHALFDAVTGHFVATLVEDKPGAQLFKLRGQVSELNAAAKTFKLGTETIYYGDIALGDEPTGLADGMRVRVRLQTTKNGAGQWVAVRLRHGIRNLRDRLESEIEGMVDEISSTTSFSINGIPVDASTAFFRDGPVALGDRVEAKGEVVNGTLKALLVKKEDDDADDRNELHGTIASVDPANLSFVLRHAVHGDVSVSYAHVLRFKDGSAANLVAGARVEVKGRLVLGGALQAVEIEFEN